MNATSAAWTITLFFGCLLGFAGIRRVTEDQGAGVTLVAQLAFLALVIFAVVTVSRRFGGDGDRD